MVFILVLLCQNIRSRRMMDSARDQTAHGVAGRVDGHAEMNMAVTGGVACLPWGPVHLFYFITSRHRIVVLVNRFSVVADLRTRRKTYSRSAEPLRKAQCRTTAAGGRATRADEHGHRSEMNRSHCHVVRSKFQ